MTALPDNGAPLRPAPSPLINLEVVPPELRSLHQWVCWRYRLRDGRWTKMPFNARTGMSASSTDPDAWSSFDDAMAAMPRFDGIGFVFSADGPYAGIDLDDCIDEEGRIVPAAQAIIDSFTSYTEVSPSGRGAKIFFKGRKPDGARSRSTDVDGFKEIEIYDSGRYFTITGRHIESTPAVIAEGQTTLTELCDRLWPVDPVTPPLRLVGLQSPESDDEGLLRLAFAAKNGSKFRRLWAGDTSDYEGDDSRADLGLCTMLAFWTGKDPERMDALFRQSGLFRDDKWQRQDYREATIGKAIKSCRKTYEATPCRPTPAALRVAAGGPRLPEITIDTDEHRVIDETVAALSQDHDVFQRGSRLVRVQRTVSSKGAVKRPEGSGTITEIPMPSLREMVTRTADLMKWSKGNLIPAHPPEWLVGGVSARGFWPGVRQLVGLADAPLLRPDGSILQAPGFDESTGVLLHLDGAFPPVSDNPSHDDAVASVNALMEIICDYRFEHDSHRATYIAALLTWLGRYAFDGPAPLFLVDANIRGAGKGLLVQTIGHIAIGREMPVSSYCHDTEEMRKKITAIAIAGDAGVLLDNLEGTFGNDALDRALTCTTWRDRILGKSQQVELPLLPIWFATGNNIAVGADTARRVVPIRLDVLEENPENRSDFRHPNLIAWVKANRGRLLTAALTILSAYIRAGSPPQNLPPMGSFEGWSNLVRQAVTWCGLPDPCESRASLCQASDTTADNLRQLIGAWRLYAPPPTGVVVSQMLNDLYLFTREQMPRTEGATAMRAALEVLTGSAPGRVPDARRVGNRLKSFRRRIVNGLCIDMDAAEHNRAGATWRLFTAAEAQRAASLRVCDSASRWSSHQHTTDGPDEVNGIPI